MFMLLLLAGCAGVSPRHADDGAVRADPQAIVYLARRGWHIDIGFRVADLEPPLAVVAQDFPNAQYVFFGFGDRRYLVSRNKNFPNMLAALWPGAGLVLATGLVATPEEAFGAGHVIRLRVSPAQRRNGQNFIWNALAKADGAASLVAKGPYPGSLYYSAVPTYSAIRTCNTWVAEALQSSGLAIRSVGVVFAAQLWLQLRVLDAAAHAPSGAPDAAAASTNFSMSSGPKPAASEASRSRG